MQTLKYIKYTSILFFTAFVLTGCESDYTRLVKSEMAKGIRQDSLLLGIKFRESREDFYGTCYNLNKQKLVKQGDGFSVAYEFTDSVTSKEPQAMRVFFYPGFDTLDIINEMNMEFAYRYWTPVNRQLQSDSLRPHITKLLMNWYGGNEFVTAHINDHDVPVKVDGNRRMVVLLEDNQRVLVRAQDLSHPMYQHEGARFESNEKEKKNE